MGVVVVLCFSRRSISPHIPLGIRCWGSCSVEVRWLKAAFYPLPYDSLGALVWLSVGLTVFLSPFLGQWAIIAQVPAPTPHEEKGELER